MSYSIRDVFYLSTSTTIASGTANGGTSQLDLSAYIDPIARGKQKGTGLAVYKAFFSIGQSADGEPIDDAEVGTCRFGMVAGLGVGDVATGGLTITTEQFAMTSPLLIASGDFYGPKSMVTNASNTAVMFNGNPMNQYVSPSENVPYIIVRDNACLVYEVGDSFTGAHILSVRLEVAQITLDQATLNQLLRTQTV